MKLHYTFIMYIMMGTSLTLHGYFTHYYGTQEYAHNNSARACEYLGACVAHNPRHWKALCNLGTIAFNEQNYNEAIKHFNKTLEVNPDCQEARERRDAAHELLKKQAEQEQQRKQQKQEQSSQDTQKSSQDNTAQNKDSDNNTQQPQDHQESSNRDQASKQQQRQDEQQEEKNKLDQQQNNQKEQRHAPEQQEAKRDSAQSSQKQLEEKSHTTSQDQQKGENSPSHYNEHADKIKKEPSLIKLTPREQKMVNKVEEIDKAAQQYMIMNTRKTGQHDTQNDW